MGDRALCIYHGNCADGFAAAWVVWKYFKGNVDFYAATYQEPPPPTTDRDVIIVDFSFKRLVMDEIALAARSVLVLDHHKSAADDLGGFPKARIDWPSHVGFAGAPACSHVGVLFDMERSGAMMAWNYFFPHDPAPKLVHHVQDRDLWQFKLPGTREIQAALFSYTYDFGVWTELMQNPIENLAHDGEAIERKHHKDVAELVSVCKRPMKIGGYIVPAASLPYTLASDAGHLMAHDQPFAACYMDTPKGRVFSLRSTESGLDVSKIAKKYGGGGHRNAAGFRMPIGWEGEK